MSITSRFLVKEILWNVDITASYFFSSEIFYTNKMTFKTENSSCLFIHLLHAKSSLNLTKRLTNKRKGPQEKNLRFPV